MVPNIFYEKLTTIKDKFEWKLIKTKSYDGTKELNKIRGLSEDGRSLCCPLQAVYGTYYFNDENEKFSAHVIANSDEFKHYPEFNEETRKKLLQTVGLK